MQTKTGFVVGAQVRLTTTQQTGVIEVLNPCGKRGFAIVRVAGQQEGYMFPLAALVLCAQPAQQQ